MAVDTLLFVSKRISAAAAALLCLVAAHLAGAVCTAQAAPSTEVRVTIEGPAAASGAFTTAILLRPHGLV